MSVAELFWSFLLPSEASRQNVESPSNGAATRSNVDAGSVNSPLVAPVFEADTAVSGASGIRPGPGHGNGTNQTLAPPSRLLVSAVLTSPSTSPASYTTIVSVLSAPVVKMSLGMT